MTGAWKFGFRGTDQYEIYRNDLDYFRERGTLETAGLFEFIRTDTRLHAGEFERLLAYAGIEPSADAEDGSHRLSEDDARKRRLLYVAFLIRHESDRRRGVGDAWNLQRVIRSKHGQAQGVVLGQSISWWMPHWVTSSPLQAFEGGASRL
ncbi:hypothetical protein ACTMU2_14135 [Cupriavidus basilensis]